MDDLKYRYHPDRSRITLNQDYEVRFWCLKFGCTEEELKKAVRRVGDAPDAVDGLLMNKPASVK